MDFNISCPGCHGFLTVSDEFVGELVQCPACEVELPVPPSAKVAKIEFRTSETPQTFPAEDVEEMRQAAPELVDYIAGATNKNGWEFGLMARIVHDTLAPLRQALDAGPAAAGTGAAARQGTAGVAGTLRDVLALQAELGQVLASGLKDAMYGNDLSEMLDFRRRLGCCIERIAALHAQPLPGAGAGTDASASIQGWLLHWRTVLEYLVEQLAALYESRGMDLRFFDPQLSLTPPTLHPVLVRQARLPGAVSASA